MSAVDTLIASDLAALGADSRRSLAGVDDSLNAKNMYRDDLPGAEARRDALADDRRRELAMMPLTLSQVFAHRVGRAAAGSAAMLLSLLATVTLADPLLLRSIGYVVPSPTQIAALEWVIVMTALAILGVYVVATWIAEAWFARRMREAIHTSGEPYQDLDALARGPLEIAQHAVRRVDGYALGGMLGGITALALVFGYLVVIFMTFYRGRHAWQIAEALYARALVNNIGTLLVALFVVAVGVLATGREARGIAPSRLLELLRGKRALAVSAVFAGIASYLGARTLASLAVGGPLPSTGERYMLAVCVTLAILGVASFALLRWREREQKRIGD